MERQAEELMERQSERTSEIAAYKSLITLANEAGLDANGLLRQSLREEEAMAECLIRTSKT